MSYKLGSLFDGSGGFPLAGSLCGIEPRWASEIEPYPIAVTRSRFPGVMHLGDISKVSGAEIEPVDIITFGSPCQDLSVAGKRAGLKHEDNGDEETTRSGLFMEAVRIIKEMREATNGVYPRFALWENVPGAFSSNKGEDFRTVLAELIGIVEPDAVMPPVPKAGWAYADSYTGDGWSLAYRVFDAQYWGVPQRRRRIHLVVDFRGQRAREVLFEREGVRGYFAQGGTPWQGIASDAQNCAGADDREGIGLDLYNFAVSGDKAVTLNANSGQSANHAGPTVCVPDKGRGLDAVTYALDQQGGKGGANYAEEVMPTLCSDSHGTPHAVAYPYTLKIRSGCEGGGKGALIQTDKSATLATNNDQYLFQPVPDILLDDQGGQQIGVRTDGKSPTLRAEMHGNVHCVIEAGGFKAKQGAKAGGIGWQDETACTLNADRPGLEPTVCCRTTEPIPIHDQATRFAGKRGDKADGKGNGLGVGQAGDPMNTLTSADRHAVAFAQQAIGKYKQSEKASNQTARQYKSETSELYQTLQAKPNGGQSLNYSGAVRVRYIVRRLTPTECARLQGFADCWGHPDQKDDFIDEELRFWVEVRNTHAAINGRAVKDYTKAQMLTWYKKLHTDSSEYKMWGNGIALPPALYCMQGMLDALNAEKGATP